MGALMDELNERRRKKKESENEQRMSLSEELRLRKYYDTLDTDSVNDDYIRTFFGDTNAFFESVNGGKSSFTDTTSRLADLNQRRDTIEGWLYKNKSHLPESSYSGIYETISSAGKQFKDLTEHYSQFKSEDDYNKFTVDWLNTEGETTADKVAGRKEIYEGNKGRISDIDKELPWYAKTVLPNFVEDIFLSKDKEALRDEAELLETENRKYDRTQGKMDKYYDFTQKDDFGTVSANRNFTNSTEEEMDAYDMAQSDVSVALSNGGYYDEEGNVRDARGNLVSSPEYKVEDKLGLFLSTSADDKARAYNELSLTNGNYTNTWANLIQEGDTSSWDQLDEDEIGVYYYLLNAEGQESAYKYLDDMKTELTRRSTEAMNTAIDESNGLEKVGLNLAAIPSRIFGGAVSLVDDASNIVQGKDINPYSRGHLMSNFGQSVMSETEKDIIQATGGIEIPILKKNLGEVYSSVMQGVDSLVGAVTMGKIYMPFMMTGAASSEAADLYKKGASNGQIAAGGILAGAAEYIGERIGLDHMLDMIGGKTSGKFLVELAKQMGIEYGEEWFTEGLNLMSDALVMQSQSELRTMLDYYKAEGLSDGQAFWEVTKESLGRMHDAGLSGAIGAIVGGGIGGAVGQMQKNAEYKKEGQTILENDGYNALKALALEVAGATKGADSRFVNRLAKVADKKTTAKNVGKLSDAVESIRTKQNTSDISAELKKAGLSNREAKQVAQYMSDTIDGKSLSETDQQNLETILTENDAALDVWNGLVGKESASHAVNKRNEKHDVGRMGVVVGENNDLLVTENTPEPIRKAIEGKSLNESKMTSVDNLSLSEDGVTRVASTGAEVTIKGAKAVEVENENGEKEIAYQFKVVDSEGNESYADHSDIDYGSSSEGLMYEAFVDLGIDPAYFDSYVSNFNVADFNVKPGDIPAQWQYAAGFNEAVNFGKAGLDGGYKILAGDGKSTVSSTYLENGEFTRGLKENVRNLAYNLGKTASENRLEAEAKAIDEAVLERKESGKGKVKEKGSFHFEQRANEVLNKQQRAGLLVAKRLTSLGNDVYIFRSTVDENGNRVDDRGELCPNGKYYGKDGSIHLDLYAGGDGSGLMVYTAAHELLHNGRRYAQREFKIFKKLLYEWYGEQYDPAHHGSLDQLINQRMEDEGVSWDVAEEEVLADFCEPFLTDGNIEERVAQLKATDEKTFNFVQKVIKKIWDLVKSIYSKINPDSTEGQFSREHKDSLERVYDAFAKMTYEASENLQWLGTISEAKNASETLSAAGVSVDADTGSAVMNSVRYAPKTDAEIDKTAKALAESMGVSVKQAEKWVRSETSLASIILDPSNAMFLDYEADERYEAIKKNAEYPQGTVDFSNLCKKRREFTALYDKLQKEFPNRVFTAEDLEKIRQILIDEKIEVACGLCYVEERRQLLGEIAQGFIDGYKNGTLKEKVSAALDANDTYVPTIYDLITYDGYRTLTVEHPSIAEAFKIHNNARGMQAGRLIEGLAEYKREILGWSQKKVDFVNSVGGLRVFSFSDFEATHLLDLVQVIQDCAAKGVMVQAYTKVPAFANAVKDTNVKVNRSLIANGTGIKIVDGRQVLDLDPVEGININDKDFFDSTDSKSVGNILVGMADDQIRLAMKSDFVDYIIPFHTGLKKDILHAKKIDHWTNYKNFQTDKDLASGKVAKTQINVYVDVIQAAESEGKPIKTKVDFVNKFLAVAKERGIKPRFWNFLDVDSNGDYVYTEGYHKFLVDFKLFDKNGNILPQMPVVPEFDDALNARILNEYVEGKKAPVSRDKVYDRLVKEVVEDGVKKSTRRDSKGRGLSKGQQEFFKDSKVTDADGNLLVVYHGTPRKFTTFRQGVAQGWGRGIYFTDNKENASEYGENIVEAYLNITNPFNAETMSYNGIGAEKTKAYLDYDMKVWRSRFDEYDTYEEYKDDDLGVEMDEIYEEEVGVFNEILRELGYDGIIADHSNNIDGLEIVAFSENQPKLTTNSNPTGDDDIRYSTRKSNSSATRGVYINDSTQAFTEQILNGEQTIETREQPKNRKYPELHKFIGQRIGIVRSGKGKTTLVGFATVADEIVYNTEAEFRADDDKHLVKKGSAYDIKEKKYGYVLEDVERVEPWVIPQGSKRNGMSDVDIASYHEEQVKFSVRKNVVDVKGNEYDRVVELEYDVFNKVKRKGKLYIDFIRDNLIKESITVYGKNGDAEKVEFAGKNERITKDGSKNPRRVLGELEQVRNTTKKLVVLNAVETAEVSRYSNHRNEHSHQWLDQNGWDERLSYVMDSNGVIYPVTLYIAKARDGRNILYDVNVKIKEGIAIDKRATSLRTQRLAKQAVKIAMPSNGKKIPQSNGVVKSKVPNNNSNGNPTQTRKSGTSARSLLANALESVAQSDIERNKLNQYKEKIDLLNEEEAKLRELNEELRKLSFPEKGTKRDQKRINDLRFEANHTVSRINTLDKMLFDLEASAPLKKVLQREKDAVKKKYEQQGKAMAREKVKEKAESISKKLAKKDLEKLVLDTARWLRSPKKDEVKCPDVLRIPFAEFLDSIDMSSKRLLRGGEATQNDLRIAATMDSLATSIEKIRNAQDPSTEASNNGIDAGYLDLPTNFVENIRLMSESIKRLMGMSDTGYDVMQEMSSEEMKTLIHVIKTLKKAIRDMQRLYTNYRFANAVTLGQNTMTFVDELGEFNGKIPGLKDFYVWQNTVPYYAFKRFGEAGESIFESFMDAQDKQAFLADEIQKFAKDAWTTKEVKEWSEDVHTILLPSGSEITLTSADAMLMYCLSRRQQAVGHLSGYGVRVIGIKKGAKKQGDSIVETLTAEDIAAINGSLSERQVEVAEKMQEFMSTTCAEWGNEISMKRFLTRMFTETNYVPIESDSEGLDTKDPEAKKSDLFRLLNISATKPLTENANNRIIVRNLFDVFTEHSNDMARLNAWGMALLDYMKWMNYREKYQTPDGKNKQVGVRQSIRTAYGDAATGYLLNFIKDVNGVGDGGRSVGWVEKMFSHGKTASVGANLRVAALQLTAYPRAALVLSPKSLAMGAAKLKPSIAKAKKYCGIALWKSFGYYDTDVSRSMEAQIKGDTTVMDRIKDASMWLAGKADEVTWGYLWNACEAEVAATGEYEKGTEEFNIAVGKKLREVVYSSQVVDSVLTRSQLMRSKNSFAKMASSFMSEPTMTHNITLDCMMQYNIEKRKTGSKKAALAKTWKHTARSISTVMSTTLFVALVGGLWSALRDDDDEPFDEKFTDAAIGSLLEELIPLSRLPLASDITSLIASKFGIGYFASSNMTTDYLHTISNAYDAWVDIFNNGEDAQKTVYYAIFNTVKGLSQFTGVPASNAMRDVVSLWNSTVGDADYTIKIRTYEPSDSANAENLYQAIVSGDTKWQGKLEALWVDETERQKDLKKVIGDHYAAGDLDLDTASNYLEEYCGMDDEDIHWQMDRWQYTAETGSSDGYSKYDDFITAVETGKNLKAVIQEYTTNGVEKKTLASQITSHFKPLYKEMSKSERAKLKGYLLNAYSVLGYDRSKKSKGIDKWLED